MRRSFNMPDDDRPSVEDGTYAAKVKKIEEKTGRDSGAEYLQWTLELTDVGARVFFITSLQQQALWNLKRLLKALEMPHSGEIDIDFDDCRGRQLMVDIENEDYQGEPRPRVRDIHPHPEGAMTEEDVPF